MSRLLACLLVLTAVQPPASPSLPSEPDEPPALAAAPEVEAVTLRRLLADGGRARRAVAALRLDRYRCEQSRRLLVDLLKDADWQVRCFAILGLAQRREPQGEDWFINEQEPRVLRTALRCRYRIDPERLARGVRHLARSDDLRNKMLAAELGAASGDDELMELARESAKKVILRMDRTDAGALSPRLAALTGQPDLRRHYRWRQWLLKAGRSFELRPVWLVPEAPAPPAASRVAGLDPATFGSLERYMESLRDRHVDLAICLDCTASMWGELAAAQGGIDDLMLFVGDVVASLRVGLVAYRDRRDDFQTRAWDFTSDIETARRALWTLTAEGGGDTREAVYEALKMTYTRLDWREGRNRIVVLVGDAPPHIGYGARCVELAEHGRTREFTTHVIQAENEDVEHFPAIAEAGGGRCVTLEDDDRLIAEIAGLTIGERFEEELGEFFRVYLTLCR